MFFCRCFKSCDWISCTGKFKCRLQTNQAGVDIRTYNVIYQAVEELTLALEGLLEPDKVKIVLEKRKFNSIQNS